MMSVHVCMHSPLLFAAIDHREGVHGAGVHVSENAHNASLQTKGVSVATLSGFKAT